MAVRLGPGTVRFTFEGFGFTQVDREIRHKGEHLEDFSPVLRLINDDITVHLHEQFASEGATGGERWADLAESTVAYKRAHDQRPEILRATDRLMDSLLDPAAGEAEFLIEPYVLVRGSRVPYGPYHQRGNEHLPQRKIFNFPEEMRRSILRKIQRWVMLGEL